MSEHAPAWRKSSFSPSQQGCVELADLGAAVLMRDSKHPEGGHLTFTRSDLSALVSGVKAGSFDALA